MAVIQTGRGVPYMRQIIVEGQTLDVKDGTTYLELAKNFQKKFDHDIVLVLENNKMRELFRKVKDGATVTFLTTGQTDGYNTYRRSATLLLLKAIYDVEGMEAVRGMKVEFSVSEGYYVSSKKMPVDQETLGRIEMRMKELVNEMQRTFSTKVSVIGNDKKGRIYIDYYSRDDLDRIAELIQLLKTKKLTLKELSEFNKRIK